MSVKDETSATANTPDVMLQVPIDPINIGWVEILATTALGDTFVVGYVLVTGSDVPDDQIVETNKGTFGYGPSLEHWYSPTVVSQMGDITEAVSVEWNTLVTLSSEEERTPEILASWIGAATGLTTQDPSTEVEPAIVGPSGSVEWSTNAFPSGYTTFSIDVGLNTWFLAIKQSAGQLSNAGWGNELVSEGALPVLFESDVTMPKTTAQPARPRYTFLYGS